MKPTLSPNIPNYIGSVLDVHPSQRQLYESDPDHGYKLSPAGRQLQRLRAAMADNPHLQEFSGHAPGKGPTLTLKDWSIALGCASPRERQLLLAAASRRAFNIKV